MTKIKSLFVSLLLTLGVSTAIAGSHGSTLDLVKERAWVKVSGAYRLTDEPPPYLDVVPYAKALIAAAPDRCVWGSDWPHVANWGLMPRVAQMLESLALYAPDEAQRHRILCENPQHLYFS